ncbi:MAG: glycosyltransferase family 2 protein [Desulfobacteraceae bacterium]|nr:glycosyltransferase family 2 protein [Desulfobacteraceae bacterium]
MEKNLKLSVIIPVYNEEDTVLNVIEKVRAVDLPKEIIVVNDCSTDGTGRVLDNYQKDDSIKVVHHNVNSGKGAAIQTARQFITGDLVIIQDADLEYNPAEYPRMYKFFVENNADAVYGSRYSGNEVMVDSFLHYYGNKFLTFLSNVFTNLHLTDMETCYKMIRADLFKEIPLESKCFGFEPEITARLAKRKARIFEVPIYYEPRIYEQGKKIGWQDGVKAIWYIVKFNLFRK